VVHNLHRFLFFGILGDENYSTITGIYEFYGNVARFVEQHPGVGPVTELYL